jgi:hypothetical protein
MKRKTNLANFAAQGPKSAGATNNAAKKKLSNMAAGKGAAGVYNKVGGAAKAIAKNPGKAGMALAGLAAAGGLGMVGAKAIGNARKPKTLGDRIKNASKKMFK